MLITNIKFATRVFLKDRFFSLLNILGLALGIAVTIVVLLILQNDLTYDKHNLNYKRIYRLGGHLTAMGMDDRTSRSARELGQILKAEFPEVLEVVRANNWDHTLVKYHSITGDEKAFYEEDIVRADSTYFKVFTHEFIAGDPKTCLREINTVVLTESKARKYFGDDDPLGKSLEIDNRPWKVTAIIKDLPQNTHLKFDILLSRLIDREWWVDKGVLQSEAFWNPDLYTYLLFPENYNVNDFYAKFPVIFNKYFRSFGEQIGGKYTPLLEPLADIHFHSTLGADEPHGNIVYLYAFTAVGLFIVLLACINYMNLSTAKSINRASEIALKKTLGSSKGALVISFLTESVLLSFISLIVAFFVVFFILRVTSFNSLIGLNLSPDFFHNPLLLFGSLGIALGIGLLSGLYPAFYLPGIPTIKALKGVFKNRKSSWVLRKVLIAVQFAISIFVVVCTLFMQQQINYMRNKELGFDKENVLILQAQDSLVTIQMSAIKNEFLQHPHIVAATTSWDIMGMNIGVPVMLAEGENGMKQQTFNVIWVGDDYLKTMGVKIVNGRNFLPGPKADIDNAFIANETAAKLMGWTKDPIGKRVRFFHGTKDAQIIGVVKDFNFRSLHNRVEPLLIAKSNPEGGFLHLKIKGDLPNTIDYIRKRWEAFDPNHPFEYFFLDERFNEQYKADETQFKLLSGLSVVCIFISMLGLLGLAAFTTTQRTKEIGIRKVHGATVPSIVFLLYQDVMYPVIVASLLVIPFSCWIITQWQSNFAYQVQLNYFIFLIVGCLALVFAFLTVAFHSLKTALTSPVKSLKYE
jgi:putative ABC transport system permease protein